MTYDEIDALLRAAEDLAKSRKEAAKRNAQQRPRRSRPRRR